MRRKIGYEYLSISGLISVRKINDLQGTRCCKKTLQTDRILVFLNILFRFLLET